MIRFYKHKFTNWDGTVEYDPNFLTVSGLPEYTLEKQNCGWNLYRNSRFVRSFKDKKAAREYLTEIANKKPPVKRGEYPYHLDAKRI